MSIGEKSKTWFEIIGLNNQRIKKQVFMPKYGLLEEVRFCKSASFHQRPNSTVEFKSTKNEKKSVITFDEEGICSACKYNHQKKNQILIGLRGKKHLRDYFPNSKKTTGMM